MIVSDESSVDEGQLSPEQHHAMQCTVIGQQGGTEGIYLL
jgi:hypothetical protein